MTPAVIFDEMASASAAPETKGKLASVSSDSKVSET